MKPMTRVSCGGTTGPNTWACTTDSAVQKSAQQGKTAKDLCQTIQTLSPNICQNIMALKPVSPARTARSMLQVPNICWSATCWHVPPRIRR